MAAKKLIDLTGAPFVVELREDGKWYIVGVKIRKREFIFESAGLPAEVVDKITGTSGDGKVNGIEEIEELLDGIPEGAKLDDQIPSEFVSDNDMEDAWQNALEEAKRKAGTQNE